MPRRHTMINAEDRKLLGRSKLFRVLTPAVKAALIRAAGAATIPAGTVMWRRGSRPKYAYILLKGRIGLLDAAEDRATVVDLFLPGAAIGGVLALKNRPYLFSGQALDEVRVVKVPLEAYRQWLLSDQRLLVAQVLELMDQWTALTLAVRNLKQLSANQRLGHYLLALARNSGAPATVRLTEDLDLMARILGVTRESLSRSFAQLRRYGVTKRAKLVAIADPHRLRRFCESPPRKRMRR